jgi:hypothetical protein
LVDVAIHIFWMLQYIFFVVAVHIFFDVAVHVAVFYVPILHYIVFPYVCNVALEMFHALF